MEAMRHGNLPGITPPLSTNESTPKEVDSTRLLVETLIREGQYEPEEECSQREAVLGKLFAIFREFVRVVSIRNGLPESLASEAGGKLFTFGSYRLGVHGSGSDIDTLCVAPKYVKKDDFFTDMYAMLAAHPEVTELTAVPEAFVPVIKFQFAGIPIDLVFARLLLPVVSDNLELLDDSLLKGLDEQTVRCLNGSRVTDEILRLVPNIETFRIALRCIKLWAKRKAIYANVMGFLGGVAWALCVARVCQLYPYHTAAVIVCKFMKIMYQWQWPQPVMLKQIEDGDRTMRVWNPKLYPQDVNHLMPIITPSYPCMCSTHNVSLSTRTVMTQEFLAASEVTDNILAGRAEWLDLFKKHRFFTRYKDYIQIIASCDDKDLHLRWAGLVESKLRQLVLKMEINEDIDIACPFIHGFEKSIAVQTKEQLRAAQEGQPLPEAPAPMVGADGSVSAPTAETFAETIETTSFYIGFTVKPKQLGNQKRQVNLSWAMNEFVKIIKMWESFDEEHTSIKISHLTRKQLPVEVHEGEVPEKAPKKRKPAVTPPLEGGGVTPLLAAEPTPAPPAPVPLAPTVPPAGAETTPVYEDPAASPASHMSVDASSPAPPVKKPAPTAPLTKARKLVITPDFGENLSGLSNRPS